MGLNSQGPPDRCPLLETGAKRDTFVLFFFFLEGVVEIKLDLDSKTQSQGRGPLRKTNLAAFLLASLWPCQPGWLHASILLLLSVS